jgi:hypothetical protein
LPSSFLCRWEGEKRNKEERRIPDVRFEEVEGHKYNFFPFRIPDVKLDLSLASELCQTVGDELFFYLAYLFTSWQNTRFAK